MLGEHLRERGRHGDITLRRCTSTQRHEIKHETILETLDHALQLTDNIQAAYLQADSTERRLFNQALFETIAIDTEEIDGHELAPPFAQLATLNHHYEEHSANGRPGRGTKKRTPDPARVRGSDVPLLVVTLSL